MTPAQEKLATQVREYINLLGTTDNGIRVPYLGTFWIEPDTYEFFFRDPISLARRSANRHETLAITRHVIDVVTIEDKYDSRSLRSIINEKVALTVGNAHGG